MRRTGQPTVLHALDRPARVKTRSSMGPDDNDPRTTDGYNAHRKILDGSPAHDAAAGLAEGLAIAA
ncbi:hypothetical protein [Streptomyces sp. NBC_00658]|uniref:hypothetical protein n=1 Tax=Streptomyces sp. NBC_00658 TaxID=2975800 RepID=UPI003249AB4D